MSPINKRGRPIQGYERKEYKIYARIEPYEYQELMYTMRITVDTMTEALRKGLRLYVRMVRRQMQGKEFTDGEDV